MTPHAPVCKVDDQCIAVGGSLRPGGSDEADERAGPMTPLQNPPMNSRLQRVVITDFINDALEIEKEVLAGVATVEALDADHEREVTAAVETAAAVMMYHNLALSASTVDRLERCQVIVRCGVGFDNVDHARARLRGIPVVNVPDYGTEEVADSAIGMTLAL